MRIDSHQHFWHFDPARDTWPPAQMAGIQHDFLPDDLHPHLLRHGFDGCIVVQKDQTPSDNWLQIRNAAAHPFIKGVIAWGDLCAENIYEQLDFWQRFNIIKGFRYVLESEGDRALMLHPAFRRGLGELTRRGLAYDLLLRPDQLRYAATLAAACPSQVFVLNHIGKPLIRAGLLEPWRQDMQRLAANPNVFCKVSGLVTEANWQHWRQQDFVPYLDAVVEAFGPDRLLYGSDWPVCNLAGGYARALGVVEDYLRPFSAGERALFWGDNAARIYNL